MPDGVREWVVHMWRARTGMMMMNVSMPSTARCFQPMRVARSSRIRACARSGARAGERHGWGWARGQVVRRVDVRAYRGRRRESCAEA
eukprot:4193498-Prymnesium_polylepis.1